MKTIRISNRLFCAAAMCAIPILGINPSASADTIFVDGSLGACGDGDIWATAYRFLQDALEDINLAPGDEIWVREGIYFVDQRCSDPVGTGDRTKTFQLVKGVLLRGGFAGGEAFAFQRDPLNNITILSGLVDDGLPTDMCPDGIPFDQCGTGGDCFEVGGVGCENSRCCQLVCDVDPLCCCTLWDQICVDLALESCGEAYHVVTAGGEIDDPEQTIIDGFTVRDGWATGNINDKQDRGGGMLVEGDVGIIRCTFTQNTASTGGGMSIRGDFNQSLLSNCIFTENYAIEQGCGISILGIDKEAKLVNCEFFENPPTGTAILSGDGGGLANVNANSQLNRQIICKILEKARKISR